MGKILTVALCLLFFSCVVAGGPAKGDVPDEKTKPPRVSHENDAAPQTGHGETASQEAAPLAGGPLPSPPKPQSGRAECLADTTHWCDRLGGPNGDCLNNGAGASGTSCNTTVETQWEFFEGAFCKGCPYTFYVPIECGTEMHIPMTDVEGQLVRVTEMLTGSTVYLEGRNECSVSPFKYCADCGANDLIRDTAAGYWWCSLFNSEIDCTPYNAFGTTVSWGSPGPPPCTITNDCPGGTATNLAHEEQITELIMRGTPGLCGIYRLEFQSGGHEWDLFSNCTGTGEPGFRIFDNCADALAAFSPLPEFHMLSLQCVDPQTIRFQVQNTGCSDAAASNVQIETIGTTLNATAPVPPLAAGQIYTGTVSIDTAGATGIRGTVDSSAQVTECSENPNAIKCAEQAQRSLEIPECCTTGTVPLGNHVQAWKNGDNVVLSWTMYFVPNPDGFFVRRWQSASPSDLSITKRMLDTMFTYLPGSPVAAKTLEDTGSVTGGTYIHFYKVNPADCNGVEVP